MPYLAVNEDGQEIICERKLIRFNNESKIDLNKPCSVKDINHNCKKWIPLLTDSENFLFVNEINLPIGTIKKITGKDISWQDEPIKI